MSTRRWLTFAPISVVALSLIFFLAIRPTGAQPAAQTTAQEGEPASTPPPDAPTIDWANAEMEGNAGDAFPHIAPPVGGTPSGPAPEAPLPPEPSAGTPPPVPPAVATPTPGAVTHMVQAGETLYEIARHYGVALDRLIAANPVPNPRRLPVGQLLTIPTGGDGNALAPAVAAARAGTYTVARGDNLYRIAQRFNVDLATLTALNQIADPRHLDVGQVLVIPEVGAAPVQLVTPTAMTAMPAAAGGSVYVVRRGDTLAKIARRFGVALQTLVSANNLSSPDRILAGWTLSIPGAALSAAATATAEPVPTQAPPAAATPLPVTNSLFIWPIPLENGWIPQWFRSGHPAIDIILPLETPIHAAAGGTIEFSGWNAYGFGNLVVIDHGNGYRTLYAHQNERLVATGDVVAQGDVIGLVGSTGRSTHPHLHFEIREGNTPLNPCDLLPGGCQ